LRRFIICLLMCTLMCAPAYAADDGDTWCMYDEIAVYIHDYLPIAAGVLGAMGVELPDALPMIAAEAGALLTELRDASMEADPNDAVKDVLIRRGLTELAMSLDAGDWKDIWTGADRVSPIITAALYRVDDSGIEQGYLLRVAYYLYQRGDITFAEGVVGLTDGYGSSYGQGEEMSTVALLNKLIIALPNARFTPEEEDIGIIWLAEELAAARNARRTTMAAPIPSGEFDDLPLAACASGS